MAGRGEVWLVDLGMTAKIRPALILSVAPSDADRALVTLVPHTTAVRNSSYEAAIAVGFLKTGAFDGQSLVTVPSVRLLKRLGRLTGSQMSAVEAAVCDWLGLRAPQTPTVHPNRVIREGDQPER